MSSQDAHTVALTPKPLSAFHRIKLVFLGASLVSLLLSVSLWFGGNHEAGLFVGIWVPAIQSFGALVLSGEREALGG